MGSVKHCPCEVNLVMNLEKKLEQKNNLFGRLFIGGALVAFFFLGTSLQAADENSILGVWLNGDKDAKVKIYKCKADASKFCGKIIWLKNPTYPDGPNAGKPRMDTNNPKKSKQTQPIMGSKLLRDFSWNAKKKQWVNGWIYAPKKGKDYQCFMKLINPKKLKIRGFVLGIRAFGRTDYWTR